MRIRFLLPALISMMVLASCPAPDNTTNDLAIELRGNPKKESQWGTLIDNYPNNIGNTFTSDPKTTRTITWQSKVSFGDVIIGNTRYPAVSVPDGSGYYFHRVDLTGLEPGKTYWYIAGASKSYSPVYSFKTQNANLAGGFSVLHVTDPQIGTGNNDTDAKVWKTVIECAVNKFPDAAFVVNTGDVVDNIKISKIPFYFDYAQETLAKYAFVYSLGNNDTLDWIDRYFYINNKRNDDPSGILYSFDYGNVHFVGINVNFTGSTDDSQEGAMNSVVTLSAAQLDWLKNDLETARANASIKWKVVILHKPDYGRDAPGSVSTDVTGLFDNYGVNLVMAGHYHFYARSIPIDMYGYAKSNGTVYTIPNTAGTKFNDKSSQDVYLAVNQKLDKPMFTELKFTETNIVLTAFTVDDKGAVVLFETWTF